MHPLNSNKSHSVQKNKLAFLTVGELHHQLIRIPPQLPGKGDNVEAESGQISGTDQRENPKPGKTHNSRVSENCSEVIFYAFLQQLKTCSISFKVTNINENEMMLDFNGIFEDHTKWIKDMVKEIHQPGTLHL